MNTLPTGQFYGVTNQTTRRGGLIITDTEYTHDYVDWHYHENPYFTFILDGRVTEGNRKETYHCTPGSLLFHNWQEAHYNIKPKGFTRGFHIELSPDWFDAYHINTSAMQGNLNLNHPKLKMLMYNIVKEEKLNRGKDGLVTDALLAELFSNMSNDQSNPINKKPQWIMQLRDILHDESQADWSLAELAQQVNVHPVHLSRDFSRYFHCSLGEYIRSLRVQRALALIADGHLSLTHIAMQCGFADQSHFNRAFKASYSLTPLAYRKLLFR